MLEMEVYNSEVVNAHKTQTAEGRIRIMQVCVFF